MHQGLFDISSGLTPEESGTCETIPSPSLFTYLNNPVLQAPCIMCRSRLGGEHVGDVRETDGHQHIQTRVRVTAGR